MSLSLIVAKAEDGAIGKQGDLPWRLSSDLKRFKQLTMGHHLIMGRKTFESIGRPLPGRTTVVITRNPNWGSEGVLVASSLDQAIEITKEDSEPFVIGGAEIYRQFLAQVDRLYLTDVHTSVADADAFFPTIDHDQWRRVQREEIPADERNEFASTFQILERL